MTIKVSDVMRHVRNHFIQSASTGSFRQEGGMLMPSTGAADDFAPGMWVAIVSADGPQGVFQLT